MIKSKHKKRKLYWELRNKLEENYNAQRSLGYKPLEKPIPHGWNMHWELRDDIKRREDAWIFEVILRDFGKSVWCKNRDFKYWNRGDQKYQELLPHLKVINEYCYDSLYPEFKHWFSYSPLHDVQKWGYVERNYICTVPNYFYKKVITRNYKTHYKVIDEVLLQEEAEINDRLDWEFHNSQWVNRGSSLKQYCKFRQRSRRRKEKREINKAIRTGAYDEMDLPGHHRHSGKWDWW